MLGLIFGIINTMLMAVLERMRELGMLMAIGMNKAKVFKMITLETLLLGLISAPIGMLIGTLSVGYFKRVGLDLSNFSKGMQKFGMSEIVYPESSGDMYITFGIAVLITAILGSLYPAFKAISLRPVEAIRKI
jgi:ABC-type antimicrobial peptide transport system permease subunit